MTLVEWAAELEAKAHTLHDINERLKKFLQTSGLAAVIDWNIKMANAETSASSGSPTSNGSK